MEYFQFVKTQPGFNLLPTEWQGKQYHNKIRWKSTHAHDIVQTRRYRLTSIQVYYHDYKINQTYYQILFRYIIIQLLEYAIPLSVRRSQKIRLICSRLSISGAATFRQSPLLCFTWHVWVSHGSFSHHQQGRVHFDTVNLPTGKDFLFHSL